MKNILLLLLLFEVGCQSNPKEKKVVSQKVVNAPQQEVWLIHYSKKQIPQPLVDKLNILSNGNFQMLDYYDQLPSQQDVRDKNQISRKFMLLANSGNLWILTFKHQADTLHYHYIACEIENNVLKQFGSGVSLVSLDAQSQVETALSKGLIKFKNLYSKDEIDIL